MAKRGESISAELKFKVKLVKKKVSTDGTNVREKKMMIDPKNKDIPIITQCRLIGLNRLSYPYSIMSLFVNTKSKIFFIPSTYTTSSNISLAL